MKKGILYNLNSNIMSLNNSKYFAGLVMIMLNLGSKYITVKFSKSQEAYLRNILGRQILIFSVAWMGTRDIYMSLIITGVFVILADFLFNEESRFCLFPERMKQVHHTMDLNGDGEITDDEINTSIEILEKAKKMNHKQRQYETLEKFQKFKNI